MVIAVLSCHCPVPSYRWNQTAEEEGELGGKVGEDRRGVVSSTRVWLAIVSGKRGVGGNKKDGGRAPAVQILVASTNSLSWSPSGRATAQTYVVEQQTPMLQQGAAVAVGAPVD